MALAALRAANEAMRANVVVSSQVSLEMACAIPLGHVLTLRAQVVQMRLDTLTVAVSGQAAPPRTAPQDVLKSGLKISVVDAAGHPLVIDEAHLYKEIEP